MDLERIRGKIVSHYSSDPELGSVYEELEASYQQLVAMAQQLSQSEERYGLLVGNMQDIVWISDPEGIITYINGAVRETLGYEPEEMIGRPLFAFMCPLHKYGSGNCATVVRKMNDGDFHRRELWMLHRDGATRRVLEVNTRRIADEGALLEIQGVGRDITERIRYERAIRKRNRQFQFLTEITGAIVQNLATDDTRGLLNDICRNIVTTLNAPVCTIRTHSEGNRFVLASLCGRYSHLVDPKDLVMTADGLNRFLSVRERTILTKADLETAPERYRPALKEEGVAALIILPLVAEGRILGLLTVGTSDAHDEDYLTMLDAIANNIAFAVERSRLYERSRTYYISIIRSLVAAMEAKDPYTQGHSVRVAKIAVEIGQQMGLSPKDIEELEIAGILHDIGKIGISDAILTKPGLLDPDEFDMIRQHPEIGTRILAPIQLPERIREGVLYHHLRWDLTGYPSAAECRELPLFARIIGVADAVDAMTSNRSYKQIMSCTEVEAELLRHAGGQFCPETVRTVLQMMHSGETVCEAG